MDSIAKILFALWISSSSIWALSQVSLGMGYRRDRIEWQSSLYTEKSDPLQGIPLRLYLEGREGIVFCAMRADGGWYVSGRTQDAIWLGAPAAISYEGLFEQRAGGWFADGELLLGAEWSYRSFLSLGVDGGWITFYQSLKRGSSYPDRVLVPGEASLLLDLSETRLRGLWWGPGIGAHCIYRPQAAWVLSASYLYSVPRCNQRVDPVAFFSYFGAQGNAFYMKGQLRVNAPGRGQQLRGSISAQVSHSCWMKLCGELLHFTAGKKPLLFQQTFYDAQGGVAVEKLSVPMRSSWHSWGLGLEIAFSF